MVGDSVGALVAAGGATVGRDPTGRMDASGLGARGRMVGAVRGALSGGSDGDWQAASTLQKQNALHHHARRARLGLLSISQLLFLTRICPSVSIPPQLIV